MYVRLCPSLRSFPSVDRRSGRHNGLIQPRPRPHSLLSPPHCHQWRIHYVLQTQTGKRGNIRSLARSLDRVADAGKEGRWTRVRMVPVVAVTACASRHSPLTDGRTRATAAAKGEGREVVSMPPWKGSGTLLPLRLPLFLPRPCVHPSVPPSISMIVVATAVVTVVVSAVVAAERVRAEQSRARVFRSALNYTFNRAAGAARWKERD